MRRVGSFKSPIAKVVQGLLQPVHAAVLLVRDRELLIQALIPALLLLLFCIVVGACKALAHRHEDGMLWLAIKSGVGTFVVLAPVPSILMANHYSRLAASAHERLQLGPCKPRRLPLLTSALRALRQVVVVAVVLAPMVFVIRLYPWVGRPIAEGILLLWALLWIVIEALDDASIDPPKATASKPPAPPAEAPHPAGWVPWFLWPAHRVGAAIPGRTSGPLRWFVRRASQLCAPWQHEIAVIEKNPVTLLGFAAATAILLSTPVLNLVFRPITIVAAVHLLEELQRKGPTPGAAPPPSSVPPERS